MEIHSYRNKSFVPTHILTLYCRDDNKNKEKYLEITEVIKNPNITKENPRAYVPGNTAPADNEFLKDLVSTIKAENFDALQFRGLIPRNVLYFKSIDESPVLMWYRDPEPRYLYFSDDLTMKTGEYQMPKMLFSLRDDELSVFRITDAELSEKTELYLVPLPNIHDDSTVCLGGGGKRQKKPKCLEDVIQKYEELFYNTRFNVFHNDDMFPKDTKIESISKNKDISKWPIKLSETKNLKKLLNEITSNS